MSHYKEFKISTQNDTEDRPALLGRRFINYLISLNFARGQYMAEEGLDVGDQGPVRELLVVEKRRRAERARKSLVQEKRKEEVEALLYERIYREIERRLADHSYICDHVMNIPENVPELVDALYAPATSSRQIEKLADNLEWLQQGLVRIVNNPPFFAPNDPKRARISNFRGAVNFVGAEDLKIIVPALAMQSWLPPAEPPFMLLRKKLWQHVFGTAVLAQRLAELSDELDPAIGFASGVFHEMGKVVLARLFLRVFVDTRAKLLESFHKESNSSRYNALLETTPDQQFLRDLMLQKDRQVTRDLFAGFDIQRVPLPQIFDDFAGSENSEDLSGYAKALYQANVFSEFRMLHTANLASLDDGKQLFANAAISAATLTELRNVSLKRLSLSRNRAE